MERILPGLTSAPNVHPMFVHFPIALWLTALLFCGIAALRKSEGLFRVGRWLLYLGTLSAGAAVVTGLLATARMGHDSPGHDLIHIHRNYMYVASGLACVASAIAFVTRKRARSAGRWVLLGMLAATVAVTTLGADRGAQLVFRYGIGTKGEKPPAPAHDHEHGNGHHPGH